MTDVVYILGTGSVWNNNEIRFSLRSIAKNGIGVGKIFVVGMLPAFLSNEVIHIAVDDIYNPMQNADGNIAHKVLQACKDKRLSDDFLFINDDHLILKQVDLKDIPAFHKGDMTTFDDSYFALNYWRMRLKRTREALQKQGLPALHFDCHTPIIFNKYHFPEVMARFDMDEGPGLTMKSLYGNCVSPENTKLLCGEKKMVAEYYTLEQLNDRLTDCAYISFSDTGVNKALKIWLYKHFPEQSPWETTDIEDLYIDILKWVEGERNYQKGVLLYEKYLSGSNLLAMFKSGESEILRKKMEYNLKKLIS